MIPKKEKSSSNQEKRGFARKAVNRWHLLFFAFLFLGILSGSQNLRAQIEGLYDDNTDQVAGINALMSAVTSRDINGVRFFSKAGRTLINQKNYGGATPLHLAAREKTAQMVKILLDNGAEVNVVDNEGWTPLMRACMASDPESVRMLLEKGASGSNVNSVGETAIVHAALSDCNECLNLMFEKFNFIKYMDVKLLKEQLTDAFVISRNRENEIAQGLLESYLDRVIKMSPLINSEMKTAELPAGSRVFKITSEETQEVMRYTAPPVTAAPVIAQPDKREIVKVAPAPVVTTVVEEKEVSLNGPRFRFIVGPQGKSIVGAGQGGGPKFKLSDNCYCEDDKKSGAVKTVQPPKEGEVIFLIKKDEDKTLTTKSGNNLFKFTPGEKGKAVKKPAVKPQVKEPVKVKVEVTAPPTAAKPVVNLTVKPAAPAPAQPVTKEVVKDVVAKEVKEIKKDVKEVKEAVKKVEAEVKKEEVKTPAPAAAPAAPVVAPPVSATPAPKAPVVPISAKAPLVLGTLPAKTAPAVVPAAAATSKQAATPAKKPAEPAKPKEEIEKTIIIDLSNQPQPAQPK